jgi:hypothetical protein
MSKLALAPIPATSLLLPTTAEFGLVESQLPVVRARTITVRGILADSGGGGSQSAVVGPGGTDVLVRVLVLELLPCHQLRGSKIVRVTLRRVELVGKHRESGSAESSRGVHSR